MSSQFLGHVIHYFKTHVPFLIESSSYHKHASVAAIFIQTTSHQLDLLFIRRAVQKRDRWSGQMAFPGGRFQSEDTSFQATAERETKEEIGIELKDHAYLGQMDDLQIRQKLILHTFVYYVTNPEKLTFQLDRKEVEDIVQVNIEDLLYPDCKTITIPIYDFFPSLIHRPWLLWWLQLCHFHQYSFPALYLPRPGETSITPHHRHYLDFVLWGLTFRLTGQLMEIGQSTTMIEYNRLHYTKSLLPRTIYFMYSHPKSSKGVAMVLFTGIGLAILKSRL